MPEIDWNINCWQESYDWGGQGEEWSESWGGSDAQWFGCIYPRIHRFVHCNTILEIAPGFGRWTRFLINCALKSYWGVDISKQCIEACKSRFKTHAGAQFHSNDGKSLSAVGSTKIDFVFSFDSLVHADVSVFESYIPQILEMLSENGVCFLHHSNLNALIRDNRISKNTPLEKRHYRDESMSGRILKTIVENHGGRVLLQEQLNWGCKDLIDCFTLFAHKDAYGSVNYKNSVNPRFMEEALLIKSNLSPYCL